MAKSGPFRALYGNCISTLLKSEKRDENLKSSIRPTYDFGQTQDTTQSSYGKIAFMTNPRVIIEAILKPIENSKSNFFNPTSFERNKPRTKVTKTKTRICRIIAMFKKTDVFKSNCSKREIFIRKVFSNLKNIHIVTLTS